MSSFHPPSLRRAAEHFVRKASDDTPQRRDGRSEAARCERARAHRAGLGAHDDAAHRSGPRRAACHTSPAPDPPPSTEPAPTTPPEPTEPIATEAVTTDPDVSAPPASDVPETTEGDVTQLTPDLTNSIAIDKTNTADGSPASDTGSAEPGETFTFHFQLDCLNSTEGCLNYTFTDAFGPELTIDRSTLPGSVPGFREVTFDDATDMLTVRYVAPLDNPAGTGLPALGRDTFDVTVALPADTALPDGYVIVNEASVAAANVAASAADGSTVVVSLPRVVEVSTDKAFNPGEVTSTDPDAAPVVSLTGTNQSSPSAAVSEMVFEDTTADTWVYLDLTTATVTAWPAEAETAMLRVCLSANAPCVDDGDWTTVDTLTNPATTFDLSSIDPTDVVGVQVALDSTDGEPIPNGATAGVDIATDLRDTERTSGAIVSENTETVAIDNCITTTATDEGADPQSASAQSCAPLQILPAETGGPPIIALDADPTGSISVDKTNTADGSPPSDTGTAEPGDSFTFHFQVDCSSPIEDCVDYTFTDTFPPEVEVDESTPAGVDPRLPRGHLRRSHQHADRPLHRQARQPGGHRAAGRRWRHVRRHRHAARRHPACPTASRSSTRRPSRRQRRRDRHRRDDRHRVDPTCCRGGDHQDGHPGGDHLDRPGRHAGDLDQRHEQLIVDGRGQRDGVRGLHGRRRGTTSTSRRSTITAWPAEAERPRCGCVPHLGRVPPGRWTDVPDDHQPGHRIHDPSGCRRERGRRAGRLRVDRRQSRSRAGATAASTSTSTSARRCARPVPTSTTNPNTVGDQQLRDDHGDRSRRPDATPPGPPCPTRAGLRAVQILPPIVDIAISKEFFADDNGNYQTDAGEHTVIGEGSGVSMVINAMNKSAFPIDQIVITEPASTPASSTSSTPPRSG